MIPSYFKNEILTIREQMVPLGSNGVIQIKLHQVAKNLILGLNRL